MSAPHDRYHALDSLRGFAMFLGVVLHAGLSFGTQPPVFWPVRDNDPTLLADVCLFAVHTFRMQTFFLLAGFFGCLLYKRYGLGGMVRHRIRRVALPFVLSVMLVTPTVMGAFLYAELENARAQGVPETASPVRRFAADLIAANPEQSSVAIVADRFVSGAYVSLLPLGHLWFLYYLLYFYAAVVLLAPLLGRLTGTPVLAAIDDAFQRLIEGRWRVLVPALATIPVLLTMKTWVSDTPLRWAPEGQILAYYFGFFAFGWVLYRHRVLVLAFGRGWRFNLTIANVFVLPIGLVTLATGIEAEKASAGGAFVRRFAAFAAQAVYTWLMIVGLWGAFLHYFARARGWARYLADASYWCYLASITPIVLLQFWVKDWPLPGLVKWGLVSTVATGVLLLSYECFVRYTVIGTVLNGRKTRARVELPPAPIVTVETRGESSPA